METPELETMATPDAGPPYPRRVASPTFVPLHVSGRLGRPPNMHEPRAQEKDASERQWLPVT